MKQNHSYYSFTARKPSWLFQALSLLALLLFTTAVSAQRMVKGTITDEAGESLIGATVRVLGTNSGTVSDIDGNYTIEVVDENSVLVFSYTGYATTEVPVGNRTTINPSLPASGELLAEVVVVGYGTQRREAVTGSVASIGGKELRDVPATNITQALQGRLAGVDISQTSSKPGASSQIRIRGTRSLSASNDPLIVLDGIPFAGSLADINPGDIKSLDILKDASATAIYGSRGANGVILISTNRGYKGQEAKISFSTVTGAKTVFAPYPMMNGADFTALREAAGQFTNGVDEVNGNDTDWQDLLYRTGVFAQHNLGVTGGSEKGAYNLGIGYNQDQAVLPGQEFKRYSLRGSIDQEVGGFIKIGLSTTNNYSISNGNNLGIYGSLNSSPLASPFDADGNLRRTIQMPLDEQWVYTRESIEALGDRWIDQSKAFGSYNNIYGELKIPGVDGLKYRLNVGLNFRMSNGGNYNGQGVFSANPLTPSNAGINNSLTTNYVIENLLSYDRTFNEKHNISLLGLYSVQEDRFNSSSIGAQDIPSDAFQFYNLGQALGEITVNPDFQGYSVSGLISYMGRFMYSYNNRYLLSATLRSDASSRLAPGNQWHTYPAISVGWNLSEELFMQSVPFIDRLKIRAGYGQTSNQAISPYSTLGRLNTRPYNFGDQTAVGYFVNQLPNENLGWEYSITSNVGVDFSMLKNRLSGTVEYYVTNTKDILLGVSLPSTSGVSSYTANIGETQNKGVELSLNGLILDNPSGLSWEAGFNFYSNKNTLVALSSEQERDEGNSWFVGSPINVIYDYERIGLWQEGDPYLDILEPGGNVGMIKVRYTGEFSDDGTPVRQIGADDRQVISVDPKFQGGFNTTFTFKGFDLTTVGVFKSGGVLISTLYGSAGYLNLMSGRRSNVQIDYWTPENTDARYPKPGGITSGDNPKYGSTLGYFDASFLKIRTISLGYDFKRSVVRSDVVSQLRVYATVQNPFVLFSPYHTETGMDPETNSFGNENSAVASYQRRLLTLGVNTPSTRNFLIGLNATF